MNRTEQLSANIILVLTSFFFISSKIYRFLEIETQGIDYMLLLAFLFTIFLLIGRVFRIERVHLILIGAMGAMLFLNVFVTKARMPEYILGIFFTFLFLLVFYTFYNLRMSPRMVTYIFDRLIIVFFVLAVIGHFEAIFTEDYRSISSLFREEGAMATSLNIASVLCMTQYIITHKRKYLYFAGFFSLTVFLMLLKKSILTNMFLWAAFIFVHYRGAFRTRAIIFLCFALIIGFFMIGGRLLDQVANIREVYRNAAPDEVARTALYITAAKIMIDYFPYGSGMGSFASIPSQARTYSQVYYDYGLNNVWGLYPDIAKGGETFFLDCYWAHIFGELGVIGALIFLCIWFYPMVRVRQLLDSPDHWVKGLAFFVVFSIAQTSLEGIALYTPESIPTIIYFAGFSGVIYRILSQYMRQVYGR